MKKRLEDIFYLCAYGVNDLSHLVVLITFETINVLMTVDASCRLLLLFLSRSWQESILGELFDSLSCAALDIFFSSYPSSLKARTCGNHAVCCFCSFLVPGRKVCFGELFDSLSCAALDIFFSSYPSSLKARTCGN